MVIAADQLATWEVGVAGVDHQAWLPVGCDTLIKFHHFPMRTQYPTRSKSVSGSG